MATLQDNRRYQAMTVAEADELFLQLARVRANIDRAVAAHKAELAELEAAHKNAIADAMAEKEELTDELTAYIIANPGRFVRPRKHPVGQIGTYGITTDKAFVDIVDRDQIVQFALDNGYDDLCRVERTPDKEAILRRIASGEAVPGAKLIPAGDVAKFSFKKGYAEALEA